MSELLSALISIADSSEFRFARFNIVYEGAQLVLPEKVRPLSPVCRTCAHQVSKRGRDTESDAVIRLEKLHAFFSNECSIGIPPEIVTVYFS